MSQSRSEERLIANRYAKALFALAEKDGACDVVASELHTLSAAMREDANVAKLLAHPLIGRDAKAEAMTTLLSAKKAHNLTQKCVVRMAHAGRVTLVPALAEAFEAMLLAAKSTLRVDVTSAVALNKKDETALAAALKAALGKEVQMELNTDPSLIGGLKVKLGGRELDMSMSGNLERMRRALKAA